MVRPGIYRPYLCRSGIYRPDFSPFGTCVVRESGSSGVWTVWVVGRSCGVVGQAHIRLWLCQDRWHSTFRGSCTLPWALPCLRVLVAVSFVRSGRIRPGLPSPSTADASSAIPQIIPQTSTCHTPLYDDVLKSQNVLRFSRIRVFDGVSYAILNYVHSVVCKLPTHELVG
jgi:hypothetical protein